MRELAVKYRKSIKQLNERVVDLTRQRDFLSARTLNPEKDPKVIELSERLRPLRIMLNDLKEITEEVEHYYDRGWWRSEEYTLNQRKSRKFIYAGPTR